ncbi:MAG: Crp/Fnr family transcriptional regulator [Bacteroidales bacterium]|jgi:CRP-like cAMP-binding protein|nr:Crp/Fnr family transcriptional regulator [Bacteroidales bacterium]
MDQECSCANCELKDLFFRSVDLEYLTLVCSEKIEIEHKAGDLIIEQGTDIKNFIYLKSGLVKLFKIHEDGKEQILTIAKPFDFVSILSVFAKDTYQYSVRALEDSVTCNLNLVDIKKLAQKNGNFAMNLLEKMSMVTDKIIQESLEIRRHNLKGRIANVILYFANNVYERDNFELPISRKEIAEYIGMTTENVIRALSEFRKDRLIKIFGKLIEITDKDRLEKLAKFG